MTPRWAAGEGPLTLSWLEPDAGDGHRLRFARLSGHGFGPPGTVEAGDRFFANWADFPALAVTAGGTLLASWLERNGEATYAYGVQLARSTDGGATWRRLGSLHPDDPSQSEHGFVSLLPEGEGFRAFWLDGRNTLAGGAMTLRSARVDSAVGPGAEIDGRVCDCCQTGAAMTSSGPAVFYRDRGDEEVRDVSTARLGSAGWSRPEPVAADGWQIPGCPVNGPVAHARGDLVAVAWFTGADPGPRVLAAFSRDGGASFAPPVVVDGGRPLGRVDLVLEPSGTAVVSWLALAGDETDTAEIRLRRIAAAGAPGPPLTAARTSAARKSGFPRLARHGEDLYLAFRQVGADADPGGIRVLRFPLAAVAPVPGR